jgi:hypothetical protein
MKDLLAADAATVRYTEANKPDYLMPVRVANLLAKQLPKDDTPVELH